MDGPTSRRTADRKPPEIFVEELKANIAANISGSVQLLSRVGGLLSSVTQAVVSGSAEAPDPSTILARSLDFALESYTAVNTYGLAMLNALVSAAEHAFAQPSTTAAARSGATAPAQKADVRVSGRPAERVAVPFVVENQYSTRLRVSFEASALRPASGPVLRSTHITFDPPHLTLEPKTEAIVRAIVDINSDFIIGETYTAALRIIGFEIRSINVSITILPPDAPEESKKFPEPQTKETDASRGTNIHRRRARRKA